MFILTENNDIIVKEMENYITIIGVIASVIAAVGVIYSAI